ncbi:MAG: hypothetical protein ACI9CF_000170 [Candidatus Omnitrophota bacterium]|jgi:hypothetical protein
MHNRMNMNLVYLAIIPLLGLMGMLWVVGPYQLGLTEDSLRYMSIAEHVAAGKGVAIFNRTTGGVSMPVVNFQPFFSHLLAVFRLCGVGLQAGSLYLVSGIFFANLFMAGLLVLLATRSLGAGFVIQIMLLLDRRIFMHHIYVLTESLFVLWIQISVFCIWKYFKHASKKWLFLTYLALICMSFTRYAATSYVFGFGLCLLLWDKNNFGTRCKKIILGTGLALLPLGVWFGQHFLKTGKAFERGVGGTHDMSQFEPLSVAQSVFKNVCNYVIEIGWLPAWPATTYIAGIVLLGVGCLLMIKRFKHRDNPISIEEILYLLTANYIVFLIMLWSWRHVTFMPDPYRFLMPAYYSIWIILLIVIWNITQKWPIIYRGALLMLLLACLSPQVPNTIEWAQAGHKTGLYGMPGQFSWRFANSLTWLPPQ